MAAIPADRLSFVQLADAPAIDMDVLQLSRHLRLFPGQGDLPIASFMAAIAATGFDGWISHEIFNDRFRMASTRRIAADGERSLIAMTGTARGGRPLPPRPTLEGTAFLEFAVDETNADELSRLFRAMGFAQVGRHRSKDVERLRPRAINLVLNMEQEGFAHSHFITHGPSVAAIGLMVSDAAAQLARAEALLAPVYRAPVGPGELAIPSVRGVGGALLYFLDQATDLGRVWDVEFEPIEDETTEPRRPRHRRPHRPVDPLRGAADLAALLPLDLRPRATPQVDVVDPAGLVESQVLQTADRSVRFTLNASQSRQTQSGRFIDELFGAGVQHVAFASTDIFATVERMRAAGVDPCPSPRTTTTTSRPASTSTRASSTG